MKQIILAVAFGAVVAASGANAGPFSVAVGNDLYNGNTANGTPTANMVDPNSGINLFDAGNALLGAGTFSRNEDLDSRFTEPDAIWSLSSNPGTIVLIGLSAGFANTFGVYSDLGIGSVTTSLIGPSSGSFLTGDGSLANPFPATDFTQLGNFGWFLETDGSAFGAGVNTWFSESTLNADGFDHMMTFSLSELIGTSMFLSFGGDPATEVTIQTSAFLVGWEDLMFGDSGLVSDDDFNDMMYLVTSVATSTVPEPGTFGMFGFGLLAVGYMARRRRYALA